MSGLSEIIIELVPTPTVEIRGLKFRLVPTEHQQALMWQIRGCCQFVWNWAWKERTSLYTASEKRVWTNYYEQANQLVFLKKFYPWLKGAPAQVLQQTLWDLDDAFQRLAKGLAGFPHRKERDDTAAFRYPQAEHLAVERNRVFLPKLGWVKFHASRTVPKNFRYATVSWDQDHGYISFCCDAPDQKTGHIFPEPMTSLDTGVKNPLTDTNNKVYTLPVTTAKERFFLKKLQRKASKRKKGGKNQKKAQAKYRKAKRHVQRRMADARHKMTTFIAKTYRQVNLEELKVKNMTGSAKGTVENPGRKVRQKAGLNRSLLEISPGEIRRQLQYKCTRYGGTCVTVDPRDTSRRCPKCDHTCKANRPTRDLFACVKCHFTAPADQVAAMNIEYKAVGPTVSACIGEKHPWEDGMLTQTGLQDSVTAGTRRAREGPETTSPPGAVGILAL